MSAKFPVGGGGGAGHFCRQYDKEKYEQEKNRKRVFSFFFFLTEYLKVTGFFREISIVASFMPGE